MTYSTPIQAYMYDLFNSINKLRYNKTDCARIRVTLSAIVSIETNFLIMSFTRFVWKV